MDLPNQLPNLTPCTTLNQRNIERETNIEIPGYRVKQKLVSLTGKLDLEISVKISIVDRKNQFLPG
jgi:hypothetical protein